MSLQNVVHNVSVSIAAVSSTLTLALASIMQWLEGALPFVSLLLGTCTVAVLLYVHILTARKLRLEIQKLRNPQE